MREPKRPLTGAPNKRESRRPKNSNALKTRRLLSEYDPKINGIAEVVGEVFGGADQFKAFAETLAMDSGDRIDAMHLLADLAAPVESKMNVDDANIVVADRLRGMWKTDYDQNLGLAQKAAMAISGSLEKPEEYMIARGWAENPEAQVKAMVFLSRIGRKIKH